MYCSVGKIWIPMRTAHQCSSYTSLSFQVQSSSLKLGFYFDQWPSFKKLGWIFSACQTVARTPTSIWPNLSLKLIESLSHICLLSHADTIISFVWSFGKTEEIYKTTIIFHSNSPLVVILSKQYIRFSGSHCLSHGFSHFIEKLVQ